MAAEMEEPPRLLAIATRQSPLALWQAEHVRQQLLLHYPALTVDIIGLKTTGDKVLDRPLSQIGGKGLFTRELEEALLDGRADLAVHSMKDVPMVLPERFVLAATLARENVADAFVSNRHDRLANLPDGAVIGTSSLRRAALLKIFYPRLKAVTLRGNLQTRLQRLDEGKFDGIILAAAGLIRLGLIQRIREYLPPDHWLPAPGQGALVVEVAAACPYRALLQRLNDEKTAACVQAERAFSRKLGGSCRVPLGAYARLAQHKITLRGLFAVPEKDMVYRAERTADMAQASTLGENLADMLISQGAPVGGITGMSG